MKKTYIFWWSLSAYLVWRIIRHFFIRLETDWEGVALFGAIALVCFFIGYRRWVEYHEYQEDRAIRNDYLKGNTPKPTDKDESDP